MPCNCTKCDSCYRRGGAKLLRNRLTALACVYEAAAAGSIASDANIGIPALNGLYVCATTEVAPDTMVYPIGQVSDHFDLGDDLLTVALSDAAESALSVATMIIPYCQVIPDGYCMTCAGLSATVAVCTSHAAVTSANYPSVYSSMAANFRYVAEILDESCQ
jgi:hypothetical protein